MGRLYVQKKLGTNVQDDLQGEHRERRRSSADGGEPRPRRQQDHLRHLVRLLRQEARREVPERALRAGDRHGSRPRTLAEYFGAAEDSIYLSGMAAGAASKNGKIGYIVPFAIPEVIRHANAFALGAQATHPGATVKLIWTNAWFDPAKEKKAAESLVDSGRRRARPERRQPGRRPVRAVEGDPVGRLRREREEVRADLVAHGGHVQLGPVLPEAGSGGDERDLEVGASTTATSRTASSPSPRTGRR